MKLEPLGRWGFPLFDQAALRVEGQLLLGVYVVLFLVTLYLRRNDFRALRGYKPLLFLALLLLTVLLNNVLWLRFPITAILPPPGIPDPPPAPSVPLLGALSVILVGVLFGSGPATIIGFVAGLTRGGLDSSRVLAPWEMAALGAIVGFLLHQDYRGLGGRLMRQPLVAGIIGASYYWMMLLIDVYAASGGSSLSALDYARSLLLASVGAVYLDGLINGLIVQGLYLLVPGLKPPGTGTLTPPQLRSMNRRLLTALIPLSLAMVLAMFYAVTTAAINEAKDQAIIAMIRGADNASQMIPQFFNTGQELLDRFASEASLRDPDSEVRQRTLEANLKTGVYGPFFSQLILFDEQGKRLNHYPNDNPAPVPSPEETTLLTRTIQYGSPERSHVFAARPDEYVMSFIVPIENEVREPPYGALVGRTRLNVNPTVDNLLSSLKWPEGADFGFVVDDRGLVAIHPNEEYLLSEWHIDLDCPDISGIPDLVGTQNRGRACQDLAADGTRRLIYYLPVKGVDKWTIVITHPYEVVLDRATRISGPLLWILVMVAGVLAVSVPWVTNRLTRPLQLLSTATRSIAEGQLDNQVALTGEDEVGQLGRAFELMRLSLKDRLEDLSLLLHVSQAVSSSLDLHQGIPTILEGALQATEARYARLILLNERGTLKEVITQGKGRNNRVIPLDRAMARLGQKGQVVTIEDVSQAKGLIEPGLADANTQALIAVPMRSKDHDVGVMWLGYDEAHQFSTTEIDFLSTLASQAAVAVENSQLFQAAEGGRRRLAAILESTSDVVIVTDHDDRVLLLNPAAAEAFEVDSQAVSGRPITEVIQEEKIIHLLTAPMQDDTPLTEEVPFPDNRTLYASASVIVSSDGQIGRVAVLRDITYLKELDQMKSDFVTTVSHDLRAPLTFMRGYATMIPMVDKVTSKQQMYVDKIMVGIEQMTELIDDLLDLGRIEAGVGLMNEPCRLDEIIIALVNSLRPQAIAKGLSVSLDRAEDVTIVVGDAALLRRAISNLMENAIKYTPKGGSVTVGWETRGDRVVISVTDTGIGIAKSDQVRLFEKFYRIKRRDTIKIKGSGLGLAIVKSIAEQHNGRTWVESELDQGSTFYIELPIGERKPA
jgi:PAS domain S-box-containing protein